MNPRQFLPALLFLAAVLGLVWLAVGTERTIPLEPLEAGPRPAVTADPRSKPLVLHGLRDRVKETGRALRERRNALAREHKAAIDQWRAGRLSLPEVERIEQLLWVARAKVGEIDERTLHTQLAELFEREHARLALLYAKGFAGEDQLRRAALYVARERHLAGLPTTDPEGRDYATLRQTYLASFQKRHEHLVDQGLGHREQLKLDLEQLHADFPPVAEDGTR